MANFDFITDEGLRNSLDSDLKELNLCHEASAWKAVHVLAGSIIEATLIDYLVSSRKIDQAAANSKDLGQLIEMCKMHLVLSNKAIELSTIVRSYRNLIHPGRVLRLSEQVDENGATIAKSVIEIVVDEVSIKKKQTYGYTAEQVVRKVRQDPSSISIAEHLLRETHSAELKRLLLKVLPAAYLDCELDTEEDDAFARRLRRLYRLGIELADPELLRSVGSRHVSVLKEEPEEVVRRYETGLFRATDLRHIELKEHPLVITHFFATMKQDLNTDVLSAAHGIMAILQGESLKEFLVILATALARNKSTNIRQHPAGIWFFEEVWEKEEPAEYLKEALAEIKQDYGWSERMQNVISEMETMVEVPF